MPLGENLILKDRLIKKTEKGSNTSNTSKASKAGKASKPRKENKATADTVKMTFYIKEGLLKRLYNFAYWDRHNLTEAFNTALTDGLKDKNTKAKEGGN